MSENATIIGNVDIGAHSSIWPGAVIRGDESKVTIGKRTCIQDNSVVAADQDIIIGDEVVIGHLVICSAKKVGDRVLLGSGSKINSNVEIGTDCLIASGAVVSQGTYIPTNSLVLGVPARIKSDLPIRYISMIKLISDNYVEKTARYKKQGGLESNRKKN